MGDQKKIIKAFNTLSWSQNNTKRNSDKNMSQDLVQSARFSFSKDQTFIQNNSGLKS